MSYTRIYRIWQGMKGRCLRPKASGFDLYGARGITVCEKWMSFEGFFEDMGPPPSDNHSIDRKDGTLGYFKDNCRWATPKEQGANTTRNRTLTFAGKSQHLAAWAREKGLSKDTIHSRLRLGWPVDRVLNAPTNRVKA